MQKEGLELGSWGNLNLLYTNLAPVVQSLEMEN